MILFALYLLSVICALPVFLVEYFLEIKTTCRQFKFFFLFECFLFSFIPFMNVIITFFVVAQLVWENFGPKKQISQVEQKITDLIKGTNNESSN